MTPGTRTLIRLKPGNPGAFPKNSTSVRRPPMKTRGGMTGHRMALLGLADHSKRVIAPRSSPPNRESMRRSVGYSLHPSPFPAVLENSPDIRREFRDSPRPQATRQRSHSRLPELAN